MSTDKCANPKCGKELIHVQGRKKKKYCDANCKLTDWQRLNPVKKDPKFKIIPLDQWNEIQQKLNGIVVKDLNLATNVVKPTELPKSNYTINTIPKTLQDVRDMCPKELTGFDRSTWIREERLKYKL